MVITNTIGAIENFELARIIEKSNFLLFSHVSEGMFRESDIEEFVWDWGKQDKTLEQKVL